MVITEKQFAEDMAYAFNDPWQEKYPCTLKGLADNFAELRAAYKVECELHRFE